MKLHELLTSTKAKQQYRELVVKYHTDRGGDEEIIRAVNNAKDDGDEAVSRLYRKHISNSYVKPNTDAVDDIINELVDYLDWSYPESRKFNIEFRPYIITSDKFGLDVFCNNKKAGKTDKFGFDILDRKYEMDELVSQVVDIIELFESKEKGISMSMLIKWCKELEKNVSGLKLSILEQRGIPVIKVNYLPADATTKDIIHFYIFNANKYTSLSSLHDKILDGVKDRI